MIAITITATNIIIIIINILDFILEFLTFCCNRQGVCLQVLKGMKSDLVVLGVSPCSAIQIKHI